MIGQRTLVAAGGWPLFFQDDFNRANGSPGSDWAGSGTISSNKLRVTGTSGVAAQAYLAVAPPSPDVDVTVFLSGSSTTAFVGVRSSGFTSGTGKPDTGIFVDRPLTGNWWYLRAISGGVELPYNSGTDRFYGAYAGSNCRLRLQTEGTVVRFKVWYDGDPEPALWGLQLTRPTWPSAAGNIHLAVGATAGGISYGDLKVLSK